ncbi:MAG: ATP-binding protein [Dehalococcoidia bacterium]
MSLIHSIKFRFTLWYLLILAATLVLLCTGIYFLLYHTLYSSLDDSLERETLETSRSATLYTDISAGNIKQPSRDLLMLAYFSGNELVKFSDHEQYILDDEIIIQVITTGRMLFTTDTTEGEEFRCFGTRLPPGQENSIPRTLPLEEKNRPVVLISGRPVEPIEESLAALVNIFMFAIPACLLIAGGGGVFLARRALKPVDIISRTAHEIEEGDLSRRIDIKTKDELGRLAFTINQMIGRLEKSFARQKQFTSDASHELRAPLAIMQAESTLALQKERDAAAYRQSLETIAQEFDHMAATVDQLLSLARSDAAVEQLSPDEVNLADLLRSLISDVSVLCQDKGLSLEPDMNNDVIITGDKGKLKRLFLNIMDNAIRYTPRGGTILVSLSCEGQTALVTIRDSGTGIPEEHIPYIFDRFYRIDKARSRAEGGSGLGLSISRQIVEAHGGEISVKSQIGKGSTFTIKLPLNISGP